MLNRLADIAHSRPRRVALVAVLFFLVAGAVGGSAFDVLKPFGFTDPDSEAVQVDDRIEAVTGRSADANVIAIVEPGAPIQSRAGQTKVREVAEVIAGEEGIAATSSILDGGDEAELRYLSTDGNATYVVGFTEPGLQDTTEEEELVDSLVATFEDDPEVTLGGYSIANAQIGERVEEDLRRAEMLALPFIILLSFIVFRSAFAALLPPMVGILSIVGTLLGLRLLAEVTDISIFAVNLVTGLGLGLAIDYSLFIVSRYREEIQASGPGLEALRRTMATAGRTVIFSALTVSAALAALMVFPQNFLFSMGLGGAMVAILAAVISLTVLPAVLVLLGGRVNTGAPAFMRRSAEADARGERGRWYRFSRWVMRRPGVIAITTAAALIAIGLPFTGAKFVFVDAGILPEDLSARQAQDKLDTQFDPRLITSAQVLIETEGTGGSGTAGFAREIRGIEGVRAASPPIEIDQGLSRIEVVQSVEPYSDRGQEIVEEIRALDAPGPVVVGGDSAQLVDQKDSLGEHLLLALAIIATATIVLLFLMTGSVLLPIKALLMNLLTVSAAFGLLVLIFQDGNLESLLSFDSIGALDTSQPILLFALVFGLSTDYAVFLLTRIKEARDSGMTTEEAVPVGLEKTGRIVTYAALLFSIAIGAFVTSDIIFIQIAGVGTALGVMIDATIVRALLVPSLMRLMGEWNWWAPKPLRKLHNRIGLSEGGPSPAARAGVDGDGGPKAEGAGA